MLQKRYGTAKSGGAVRGRMPGEGFMNVFDIIGPVMIGPSSSHTAGAARLGGMSRALLGAAPVRARIELYGSFAKTYRGHGTDKALIAGIMGMQTDDVRLRHAPELAKEAKIDVEITEGERDGVHPNTAFIQLWDTAGKHVSLLGSSIGGGNILVMEVNGMPVEITGQKTTLIVLHRDTPGTIAAVTELLAAKGVNICNFRLSREHRGGEAVMSIEMDGEMGEELAEEVLALDNIYSSTMLRPVS